MATRYYTFKVKAHVKWDDHAVITDDSLQTAQEIEDELTDQIAARGDYPLDGIHLANITEVNQEDITTAPGRQDSEQDWT